MTAHARSRSAGQRPALAVFIAMIVLIAGCAQREAEMAAAPPPSPNAGIPTGPDESEQVPTTTGRTPVPGSNATVEVRQDASGKAAIVSPGAPAAYYDMARRELAETVGNYAVAPSPEGLAILRLPSEPTDRENYAHLVSNPVHLTGEDPVSTFSIDVDTASYSNVRRILNMGRLPQDDAVRVEELINYFSYDYPVPRKGDAPFTVNTEIAPAPWNPGALLLQVGIKGYAPPASERPAANLVFLVDVSGSMQSPDKLPLLKNAFRLLTNNLTANDSVAMVVYAGATGLVLDATTGDKKATILGALDQLEAGGSTNGGAGIQLAYRVAHQHFIVGGINRVLLATDGDFNVGTVSHEALIDLVEQSRDQGVALTTLGFGQGNYNDHLLEQLADKGNGNSAYIDTLNEARKVLVEELASTLQTIAKDVKIQIEFNPARVAEYRLIGYENRILRREDFNNDRIDAGEIGAGHTVTALYELKLVDSASRLIDPLRYGPDRETAGDAPTGAELAYLRLRYKAPEGGASTLIETPLAAADVRRAEKTSDDFRFAAAVAAFGQILRGGEYLGGYSLQDAADLARGARGMDPGGYRGEFLSLISLAQALQPADRVATR